MASTADEVMKREEAVAGYSSPVFDQVARDAFARLVIAGPKGMTVRELADGGEPFVRASRRGCAYRWRVRGIGGAA